MNRRLAWLSGLGIALALLACSADETGVGGTIPMTPTAPEPVLISELMYHPVEENAAVDNHEFIEIHNRSDAAVDLSGWKLGGMLSFTFPAGASIPANGYKVIAKNKAALAGVTSYMLNLAELHGDYGGELDNGGGTVTLVNAAGTTVDTVKFNDHFPWPIGADAMGADDEWLALLPTPLTQAPHQYRGRSIERISYDVPSGDISNWAPSPLDGATPGRANSTSGTPPTIVLTKTVTGSSGDALIRAADAVKIAVTFSTLGKLASPKLQYFVDNVQISGEPVVTLDLTQNNGAWEATLPPQPDNSIVRYRIQADRGSGQEVLSPRPSDPLGWWAYFVSPPINTTANVYHLFIKKSDWTQLYDNINFATDDRRVAPGGSAANRCMIRPSWDATVPAVFVYNGEVYDTFVRYQGSRFQRTNGITLDATKTTISPLPDRPVSPYRVLSWKINFPDYAPFENKRSKMVLNKLNQACPGLDDTLGERIYGDPSVSIPVQATRYARFHVNGGYYHYMLDIEHIDGDMMKRYRGAPGEPVGDVYKSDGNAGPNNIEGPWGLGDERTLVANPDCPMWTIDDRYAYTYQRMNNGWKDSKDIRTLIETLNTLRAAAVISGDFTAVRAFFMQNFDYQKLLDYIAIRNWAQTWDDQFHNHFLYQRATDGKWLLIPQDKDLEFGEFYGWAVGRSFYVGEEGDIDNRGGFWNRIKDAFIKAFRKELWARLVELDASGILNPVTYRARVDQAAMTFSLPDYMASPAAVSSCSFSTELGRLRSYGDCRHQDVLDGVAAAACTPTTCGLKAMYYQTMNGDTTRDFTKAMLKLTRTDPSVNFDWGGSSPDPAVPADGFQVRWTGKVTPRYTEQYTFYTQADDGVRLTVNGTVLIDKWMVQNATEYSGTISLTAGTPVTITLDYFDSTGTASTRLFWASTSQCKQPIPTSRLSPM